MQVRHRNPVHGGRVPVLAVQPLYYVHVLAHYQRAHADGRFAEAVRELSAHVNAAGEMVVDSPPRGWQSRSFARKDLPSELATSRWRQIQALVNGDPAPYGRQSDPGQPVENHLQFTFWPS